MRLLGPQRPIETVAEAERIAKKRLPAPVYNAVVAGRERGVTIKANIDCFDEIGFRTRIARDLPPEREFSTTVMGQELSLPVILSPAGVQAIAPGGEVPAARAAAKVGTAIGHSNFASMAFEEVAEANPKSFAQIYWIGPKDVVTERVERMRKAGAAGLIFTLDALPSEQRDWGSPVIPDELNLKTMVRFAPVGLSRPGWTTRFLMNGGLPDLRVPNLQKPGGKAPTFLGGFTEMMATPLPTWEDVRWLRELWGGPFMVKGIMNVEDAKHAVDAGATAISVSNHGGNNLDSTPSALRALPSVVDAVGDQVEVVYDGGIRRGGDVLKAMALGARATMIGRAYLFGLAARGEQGVEEVLGILRHGMDIGLIGMGHESVHDLSRDDLYIPDGFGL